MVLHPAKITPENIKGFIQGNFRLLIKDFMLPDHIREQAEWRLTQVSEACFPKCHVCGCEITGKVLDDRPCSKVEHNLENPCYPKMMNKEEWESFKKTL